MQNPGGESWGRLADLSESEREPQMRARYAELVGVPEEQRRAALKTFAQAEYALPDGKLRPFTKSRMRVWLSMNADEARTLALSYDAIMNQMPAVAAMKRVSIVQSLSKEFSEEDQARLRAMAPTVFTSKSAPPQSPSNYGAAKPASRKAQSKPEPAAAGPKGKKAWWAFWKTA